MLYLITIISAVVSTHYVLKHQKIDIGSYEENVEVLKKVNVPGGYSFQGNTWIPFIASFYLMIRDYIRISCVLWMFSDSIDEFSFVNKMVSYGVLNYAAVSLLDMKMNGMKELYLQLLFGICYSLGGDVKIAEVIQDFLSCNLYFMFENKRIGCVIFACKEEEGQSITREQFDRIKETINKRN